MSLASAAAANRRLHAHLDDDVTPTGFLELDDQELRMIGFSRQKTSYVRGLAAGIADGEIDLACLEQLPDAEAEATLLAIRGVGRWTAGVYLMFVLDRPDIWPPGDRALHVSMASVFDLAEPPSSERAEEMAERWSPWRSAAARLLWHEYLGGPDVVPPESDSVDATLR